MLERLGLGGMLSLGEELETSWVETRKVFGPMGASDLEQGAVCRTALCNIEA